MNPWRFVYTHFLPLLCVVIFISALVPKLFLGGLSTQDDPYYHAAHATAYYHGEMISLPVFSPLATHPTDPWFLYHWGMVPFIAVFSSYGVGGIFFASKIYHALLTTGLFAVFFVTMRSAASALQPLFVELLSRSARYTTTESSFAKAHSIAIASVLFAFLYGFGTLTDFAHRALVLERPHILMITLVLVAFLALVHKRIYSMLIVCALAALSYSMSILVLLPLCAAIVWWVVGARTMDTGKTLLGLTAAGLIGLAAGVALHPESANYLTSGILMHAYAVYHSFTWWVGDAATRVSPPSEMFLLESTPPLLQLCAVGVTAFVMYLLATYRRRSEHAWLLLSYVTAGGIGIFFTLVQICIPRAAEYSIPFLALTTTSAVGFAIMPIIHTVHAGMKKRTGEIGDVYRSWLQGAVSIKSDRRLGLLCNAVVLTTLATAPVLMHGAALLERDTHDYTRYREVAEYLTTIPDHVVLNNRFDLYPQLVFLAPHNHYGTGMDSRFIGLYDPILASDVMRFFGTDSCTESVCEVQSIPQSFYEHKVTHILVDEALMEKTKTDALATTPQLQLVLTDSRYTEVKLYEIVPETVTSE